MRFSAKVFELLKQVPKGKVTTYKIIAEEAGSPKAYMAVGSILHNNPCLIDVPCHRVVRSSGDIGGYKLGQDYKLKLLKKEGVKIENNTIDMDKHLFKFKLHKYM
jgi:methylated-DNA-[protein]-cysteine S-methyltransferase